MLTGIQKTSYEVVVSVSDSKDDFGNPDTAIDTSTDVTITVTTTTTTTSGGSGQQWRRRRRQQPPCPNANPNAYTEPNAYGDPNAYRTAVLRRDCRGAQRDCNGGS